MFDGLKLDAARPAPERAGQPPASGLEQAAERYARAWTDADRMRAQRLPVLEYQKRELREAAGGLDAARPDAVRDLHDAMRYEPSTFRAMKQLSGPERGAELAGAIRHEERVRRDPALQAERLVKDWQRLEARHDKLRGFADKGAREKVEKQMQGIAGKLKRDPQLESLVRARAKDMGIDSGTRLGRVMDAPSMSHAAREIVLDRARGLSR
jgi:hypothetical protein